LKVLLVAPPIMDYADGRLAPAEMDAVRVCPPYGVYLLAAVLRSEGHEVVLADLIAQKTRALNLDLLRGCGLVGLSATSLCWPTALDIVRQIRAAGCDTPIVLGGIHPTMFDRYLLSRFPVDFVIRGEAERALPALCLALSGGGDLRGVPNLSYKAGGGIIRNPLGPKLAGEELSRYPVPDYGELPPGAYRGLALESSRGCALDCSFCSTPYRRSWRGMPPEVLVDRLEAISRHLDRTAGGAVHLIDDEFSMNPSRAAEICRVLTRRKLRPKLIYDSRAIDFTRPEFSAAVADFTHRLLIGAECGYDEGLKRVGKGTTTRHLAEAARVLARHRIAERAEFSFILGLPWEGPAEVERTLRYAAHLFGEYGVHIRLNWYTQMPGSRLWEEARAEQRVSEAMYDDYGFYRDLYLFRSGVRLAPREIWAVYDIVEKLQLVGGLLRPESPPIDFFFPGAIEKYFPKNLLTPGDTGLTSLRQIARPAGSPVRS
jgi:anaerobic magnesium-protoporphyrin IX monomethyl ester cyclase